MIAMKDLKKTLFSPTKQTMASVFSVAFVFIAFTMVFLLGNSRVHPSSDWVMNMLRNRSQFPSYLFHNTDNNLVVVSSNKSTAHHVFDGNTEPRIGPVSSNGDVKSKPNGGHHVFDGNTESRMGPALAPSKADVTSEANGGKSNSTDHHVVDGNTEPRIGPVSSNGDVTSEAIGGHHVFDGNTEPRMGPALAPSKADVTSEANGGKSNSTDNHAFDGNADSQASRMGPASAPSNGGKPKSTDKNEFDGNTESLASQMGPASAPSNGDNRIEAAKKKKTGMNWLEKMSGCDVYDGKWVKDNSPPLYERGSCHHIDESFNCYLNGRPEYGYENFRWQPNHCDVPRLDGKRMLKFFEGKRVVYVGDSLNRNMFESMVCLLMNSVEDKSKVFEVSGKIEFKKEGAYSFRFPDQNLSVEYIRSAFLVQESEIPVDNNGTTKETLRIDLIDKSYDTCKDADVLIFNTGNWWTHEKTSEGKGYYQEGNHVHEKLDVLEAFDRAMATWARWVETNVNSTKTNVFFRGYTVAHFSKGEWNSGGQCDSKEPIMHNKDLLNLDELSPSIPQMLDNSLRKVKSPVSYLNVTRMTNYRQDAHPSSYRMPNATEKEMQDFQTHQDCSHWCLPGVPDTWNQLLFAQLLLSHKQRQWNQTDNVRT